MTHLSDLSHLGVNGVSDGLEERKHGGQIDNKEEADGVRFVTKEGVVRLGQRLFGVVQAVEVVVEPFLFQGNFREFSPAEPMTSRAQRDTQVATATRVEVSEEGT